MRFDKVIPGDVTVFVEQWIDRLDTKLFRIGCECRVHANMRTSDAVFIHPAADVDPVHEERRRYGLGAEATEVRFVVDDPQEWIYGAWAVDHEVYVFAFFRGMCDDEASSVRTLYPAREEKQRP